MTNSTSVSYGSLPYTEAIEYFKQKLIIPSKQWNDLTGSIHAKGFTIAGATKLELLQDFYKTIGEYITNGDSLGNFLKDFDAIAAKHGWSYKGDRRWRAKVILNTNKRSAYMAGRWQQLQRVKTRRPYLIYMTVDDGRVRDEHQKWHLKVYHIDDPFWKAHYPPNGWMCRCYVRSASQKDLDRLGLKVGQSKVIEPIEIIDSETGVITKKMPGIDVGWDYNVGKAWLAPEVILGQQLMELPTKLRKPALDWFDNSIFDEPFKQLVDSTAMQLAKGNSVNQGLAQTAGYLTEEIIEGLATKNLIPVGAAIVVRDGDIAHWLRHSKNDRGASVPLSIATKLPRLIRDPNVVLFNGKDLVFAEKLNDGRYAKFVLKLNFNARLRHNKSRFKEYLNVFKSAGIVLADNLREPRYEIIKGKIE